MNQINLLTTPIADLTDEELDYIMIHHVELQALIGTPEHTAAVMTRRDKEAAKRKAEKAEARAWSKERRRRVKDDADCKAYMLRDFYHRA